MTLEYIVRKVINDYDERLEIDSLFHAKDNDNASTLIDLVEDDYLRYILIEIRVSYNALSTDQEQIDEAYKSVNRLKTDIDSLLCVISGLAEGQNEQPDLH